MNFSSDGTWIGATPEEKKASSLGVIFETVGTNKPSNPAHPTAMIRLVGFGLLARPRMA
jgi:hypothetical protein